MKRPVTYYLAASIFIVMLLTFIAPYLFFSSETSRSPSYIRLRTKCTTCSFARSMAINDFKNNNFQIIAWGLIDQESATLKNAEVLKRQYRIKTLFGGCIRSGEVECYNRQMRKLLAEKFGLNDLLQ